MEKRRCQAVDAFKEMNFKLEPRPLLLLVSGAISVYGLRMIATVGDDTERYPYLLCYDAVYDEQ